MKLDVGCGDRPRGDVNTDLFIGWTPHLDREDGIINPKVIPNFVRCDAHYLPFIEKVFDDSICSHVLEHIEDPMEAVKELVRVTKNLVTIIVPHRYAARKHNPTHIHFFDETNIRFLLKKLNIVPDISVKYRYIPHDCLCIVRFPAEMTIQFKVIDVKRSDVSAPVPNNK